MERLLLYDQWFKYKHLYDEYTYAKNLIRFYATSVGIDTEGSNSEKAQGTELESIKNNIKIKYPHGYEEEFKLLLDSSQIMEVNLDNIYEDLNSMAKILTYLSDSADSRSLRILFLEKYMKIENAFSQCLKSFNFLQRKLESLINVYPAYFPEPKIPSFKEVHKTHTYIELLLDEFSEILRNRNHILRDHVPKNSNFYWRFEPDILFFIRETEPEKDKILIVNSDFYTIFRHSQWILFFHEILHAAIDDCLKTPRIDKNCKKILDVVRETSISIYSIIKSFNAPRDIFFDPQPLVIDVFIDINLAKLFLEKYIIAAFLKLFLYDQISLYSFKYAYWFIRLRTLRKEIERLHTHRYKFDIFDGFSKIHEEYFLGKYGSFLHDLYEAVSELLIKTMETYPYLLKLQTIENEIKKSRWISTYLSFLDNFYDYTIKSFNEIAENKEKTEKVVPQRLLKETFENIYSYERDALIHAFSRNIFPLKQESYTKKTEDLGVNQSNEAKESNTPFNEKPVSLILKLYKYRYDTPKREFKHNIYNCGDYTTVEFIYGKQGGEENGEMLEKQQGQADDGYKYEWHSYLVELYRHNDILDNDFFGNLTEKLLILSKLSFSKKTFKEFRKGSKNSESELLKEILKKFAGLFENDGLFSKEDKNGFRIYSSFDWYDLTVLFSIKLNKKLNYNDLSEELFNVYTNLTTKNTETENAEIENTKKLEMDKISKTENTNITNFTETLIFVGENAMDKFVLNSPELLIRVSNDEESYAAINKIMSKEQLRKVLGLNENDFNVKLYLGKIDVKIVFNGDIECSKLRNYIEILIELDKPKIFEVRIIP